jgi:ABC-type Fe3+-hydroxamate transport system substrate-binding protein
VTIGRPVRRVVSIVPSLTESVARTAPGLLVGATDWCSQPPELDVRRVRGTKNPDRAAIVECAPDLVLANAEENRAEDLAALRAAGLAVYVTAPTTVPAALDSLGRMLGDACGLDEPEWLARARDVWSRPRGGGPAVPGAGDGRRRRGLVPIWRRPWMALGRDTFAGDVLRRLGVDNVLAGHADRYPRIDLADLPPYDLVVLPDEPYAFSPADGPEMFPDATVACVSGRHLTWYGPSLAEAPAVLGDALAGH